MKNSRRVKSCVSRSGFACCLIVVSGLLASCVTTGEKVPFPIAYDGPEDNIGKIGNPPELPSEKDKGKRLNKDDILDAFQGQVIFVITPNGHRHVYELANLPDKQVLYRTDLDGENNIESTLQSDWYVSGNLLCGPFTGIHNGYFICLKVFQYPDQFVAQNLKGDEQYRFIPLGEMDQEDNKARFSDAATPRKQKAVTTEEEERPVGYWIGVLVGYSELCNTFFGYGLDPLILKNVRNHYENEEGYKVGYHRLNSASTADGIDGLTKCREINEELVKLNDALDS